MSARKRIRVSEEEYDLIHEIRGLKDVGDNLDIDLKHIKHAWLKNKDASIFIKNPGFEQPEFDPDKIDWKYITKDLKLTHRDSQIDDLPGLFDRLVYTDTHIGMNPNTDGYSLYGGKWDEEELMIRLSCIINHVINNQQSNTLIVDDLGDLMDGWDAKTVRREHDLPQNMDNQKAFDVALRFKVQMLRELSAYYDEILINNICEDNHSGSFGYVVNSAFKTVVDNSSINANITNHRRFINHYQVDKYIFIITHGKDSQNMKFGFKPQLDKVQMEKIDNYIDTHYLLQPGVQIEFSKGDSHQMLFDWSGSDRFKYFNYPALSPSSNWIQTNYKRGKSGCVFFNYSNSGYSTHPLFFPWKE